MQIPIQFYWKRLKETFPYIIIVFLLTCLFFQRENYSERIKAIQTEKKAILSEIKELELANEQLTMFIDKALSEREKIIEKHYHTKEVINNKIIDYEKDISNIPYNDSVPLYISNYRYKPFGETTD